MQQRYAKNMARTCILLAILACQACSATPEFAGAQGSNVINAYETSGIVKVPPYTRTIFSTHNF